MFLLALLRTVDTEQDARGNAFVTLRRPGMPAKRVALAFAAVFVARRRLDFGGDPQLARAKLYLGSVRVFRLPSGGQLAVIHLSTGTLHLSRMADWKPSKVDPARCRTAPSCMLAEPMMHHGNGFDVLIRL